MDAQTKQLISTCRIQFLDAVRSKIGCPYKWGAEGPFMFDCSGLVRWGLNHTDIFKKRIDFEKDMTANYMCMEYFANCHVEKGKEEPGDLLFYGTTNESINHVMILNWFTGSIIGARGGDATTITTPESIRKNALVDVKWMQHYWKSGHFYSVNPFLKVLGV